MMVASVSAILSRFKAQWVTQLQPEAIIGACEEVGYTSWRDRVLTPVTTIQLFLLQILHGNTSCTHLPHLSGVRISASAYCQARTKRPLAFFCLLFTRLCASMQPHVSDEGRWHGHRTFLVDGSGCSMPDTPTHQEACGQLAEQRLGCGFPIARMLGLFNAGTGLLLKLVVAPLLPPDLAQVRKVHPTLARGEVLVADGGLCSCAHLTLLAQARRSRRAARRCPLARRFHPRPAVCHAGVRRTPAVKGMPDAIFNQWTRRHHGFYAQGFQDAGEAKNSGTGIQIPGKRFPLLKVASSVTTRIGSAPSSSKRSASIHAMKFARIFSSVVPDSW